MLRGIVLPLAIGYAGILVLLIAGARRAPGRRRETKVAAPKLVHHVLVTALGGTTAFLAGMLAYCGGRGVDVRDCLADPIRGALPLAAGAAVALLAIESVDRLVRR